MNRGIKNTCCGEPYVPDGLLLQWHITERCNLRCSHCYQDGYSGQELDFGDLLNIMSQFKDLLKWWSRDSKRPAVTGHITVTGGEPFVRADFVDLLEVFAANREHFSFAVLSNGSFIDGAMARRLRGLAPRFVQISIEGTRARHDEIRGAGNFDRTISAIRHLIDAGVRTLISFTAHRRNYREFGDVARLGTELGVSRVWADRLIPSGGASTMAEQMLGPKQTREFFEIMAEARAEAQRCRFGRTEIAMHRALQFQVCGGRPYHCTAGDTLVTVQANGDLYPCRRMPIRVGNLMETPLARLYYDSHLFRALRDRNRVSEGCGGCLYERFCRGGLKCLAYAVTGDPFGGDPGCRRAREAKMHTGFDGHPATRAEGTVLSAIDL